MRFFSSPLVGRVASDSCREPGGVTHKNPTLLPRRRVSFRFNFQTAKRHRPRYLQRQRVPVFPRLRGDKPSSLNPRERSAVRRTVKSIRTAAGRRAKPLGAGGVRGALVVSDNIQLTMDTAATGAGPVTAKEFVVPYAGRIRVTLQLKSDGSHEGSAHAFSEIDFCTVTTMLATFETFTCQVRVLEGDLVKVAVAGQVSPLTFATIRRVRVFYDVVDASGLGKVLMD